MRILQFAFGGDAKNHDLPHNYIENCIAYTGTHDNDTAIGWFESAPPEERVFALRYLNSDGSDFAWDLSDLYTSGNVTLIEELPIPVFHV